MRDGASLFVTGGRGFIGRHLLRAIDPNKYTKIYCLSRVAPDTADLAKLRNLQWIRASLDEPDSYDRFLASSDAVIHLAATTGKARPEDYFQVNLNGTRLLTEQCRRLGVTKFVFVSSIAAKFLNKSQYYYAQSKQKAEELVSESGLNYAIVRPTIVLGKESSIWQRLSQFAKGPFIVLFGEGSTKVQPVFVNDLVGVMLSLVNEEKFSNEIFEVGGPDVITLEDFLKRINFYYRQKNATVIRVPLKPLVRAVSIIEKYAFPLLPFNAGQLAAFANDGTAEPNDWVQRARPRMKNLDAMLTLLTDER